MISNSLKAAITMAAILLSASSLVSAQENVDLPRASYLFGDGMANPASPEVSSVAKYGDISGCDFYTGTFGYSIPIFTYKDRDFNIPIAISYASNGYKPNIQTGILGLGWHLSTGWAVTREVLGIMDDSWPDLELYHFENKYVGAVNYDGRSNYLYGYSFLHKPSALEGYIGELEPPFVLIDDWVQQAKAGSEYLKVKRIYENGVAHAVCFEDAPDIYHFSVPGERGNFILRPDGGSLFFDTSGPESGYCLKDTLTRNGFTVFYIRNADGYQYTFANPDVNQSWSSGGINDDVRTNGSWKLTEIVAPSGATAKYNYGPETVSQSIIPSYTNESHYRYTQKESSEGDDSEHEYGGTWYNTNYSRTESNCLTSIVIRNAVGNIVCEIIFTYSDKALEAGALTLPCKKLSGLTVRNSQNDIVRECSFEYCMDGSESGYSASSRGMTFLKSVTIEGEGTYNFEYDGRATTTFPAMGTWQMDWYGYWNPSVNQSNFSPQTLTYCRSNWSTRPWLNSLRQADTAYAKKGILNRITYPTGGYSIMMYEANEYSADRTGMTPLSGGTASGVRISGISTYDPEGCSNDSRSFSYIKADGSGSGRLIWRPEIYCQYSMSGLQFHSFQREVISTSNDFPYMNGNFIEYSRVLEYHGGGYVEYQFSNVDAGFIDSYGTAINELEEQSGSWYVHISSNISYPFIGLNCCQPGSLGGHLELKKEYDGNMGCPVNCETATFGNYGSLQYVELDIMRMGFGSHYRHYIPGTRTTMTSSEEYSSVNHSDIISSVTSGYGYDSLNRLSFLRTVEMGADTLRTVYRYHPSALNLLSGVDKYRNSEMVYSENYNYTRLCPIVKPYWYVPTSMEAAQISDTGTASYYTKISFNNYDALGNPGQSFDAQGNKTVFEWGSAYDGMYLTRRMVYPSGSSGNSLISTWTWKPLVGILSEANPSGKTMHYTYDSAGRLITRKENNTVLNDIYYNISGNEN